MGTASGRHRNFGLAGWTLAGRRGAALGNLIVYTARVMKKAATALFLLLAACVSPAYPQGAAERPVQWTGAGPDKPVRPGETFEVRLEAAIAGAWHLYSATQPPGGPNPTRFSLVSGDPFKLTGAIRQSPPKTQFDANFGIETEYFAESADFRLGVTSAATARPGDYTVQVQAVYQVCDDQVCLPPTKVPVPVKVTIAGPPAPAAAAAQPAAPDVGSAPVQHKAPAASRVARNRADPDPGGRSACSHWDRGRGAGSAVQAGSCRSSGFR